MTRLAALAIGLAVVSLGCRAPGEPPQHPQPGAYSDVMRRELDSAKSALATGGLVLRYDRSDLVPRTFARVTLRQAANDLRKVAQDLGEITPPARAARAHALLLAICRRDQRLLSGPLVGNRAAAGRVIARIAADTTVIDRDLTTRIERA